MQTNIIGAALAALLSVSSAAGLMAQEKQTMSVSERLNEVDLASLIEQYRRVTIQLQELQGQIASSAVKGDAVSEKERAWQYRQKDALAKERKALKADILAIGSLTEQLKGLEAAYRQAAMQLEAMRQQEQLSATEGVVRPDKEKQLTERRMDFMTQQTDQLRSRIARAEDEIETIISSRSQDEKAKGKSS